MQRGNVPERPIDQWKNDLEGDRLSSHGFTANAMRLGLSTLAYAIMVLFREAMAEEVPELAKAEVGTIRQRLLKVGARVTTSARRIWFHFSASWPTRELFVRVCHALDRFVATLMPVRRVGSLVAVAALK